jgi:hypothetical protein
MTSNTQAELIVRQFEKLGIDLMAYDDDDGTIVASAGRPLTTTESRILRENRLSLIEWLLVRQVISDSRHDQVSAGRDW